MLKKYLTINILLLAIWGVAGFPGNGAQAAVGKCRFAVGQPVVRETPIAPGLGHIIPATGQVKTMVVHGSQVGVFGYEGILLEPCFHSYKTASVGDLEIGIDIGIGAGVEKADIVASLGGIVTRANYDSSFGYFVEILNTNGAVERYAHMRDWPLVTIGQPVKQKDKLGVVGSTGDSIGPHLHWTVDLALGSGKNPFQVGCELGGCTESAEDAYLKNFLETGRQPERGTGAVPIGPDIFSIFTPEEPTLQNPFGFPQEVALGPAAPTPKISLGPISLNVLDELIIPYPGGSFNLQERIRGDFGVGDLIQFIFIFTFWVSGIIAFLALVYAGFLYIVSGANPAVRSNARKRLGAVFWGMGILLFSVVIVNTINPDIGRLEFVGQKEVDACVGGLITENCITRFYPPTLVSYQGAGLLPRASGQPAPAELQCRSTSERFENNTDSTLEDASNVLCASYNTVPVTGAISQWLANIVGSDSCSTQDVQEVRQLLEKTCGKEAAGGEVGGVVFNENTVSSNICQPTSGGQILSGVLFTGDVIDGELIPYSVGVTEPESIREDIENNALKLQEYCKKTGALELCKLLDEENTNITNMTAAQLGGLVDYCVDILP